MSWAAGNETGKVCRIANRRRQRRSLATIGNARGPVVYAFLDADYRTLYVGSSVNLFSRIHSHRRKPWWRDVAFVTWHKVNGGKYGLQRFVPESDAIALLDPPHNTHCRVPGYDGFRSLHTRVARSARHPDARILFNPFEDWLLNVASGTISVSRYPFVAVTSAPVSEWRAA